MSLTVKIGSLVIRTLAKPVSNAIKSRAREHETFRKYCIGFAQGLHRIDMRLRLGLLQDPAVIDRQIAKEVAEAEARRRRDEAPTVKTKEQSLADEQLTAKEREKIKEKAKAAARPRIRPLSEAKAIETGANFISETFLFAVAGGLIIAESLRSRWKESNRREDVADRLDQLESQIEELSAKNATLEQQLRIKHAEPPKKPIKAPLPDSSAGSPPKQGSVVTAAPIQRMEQDNSTKASQSDAQTTLSKSPAVSNAPESEQPSTPGSWISSVAIWKK
ncbi:hypothetical protein K402DRAFT_451789 [Aulographum hederae CBS 113979]|uniref:OPA3-domain-containing protein n=1 Tax=Aulographum hederae CBS 113979 TaxID=1176131 RepID=A0A6G1H936_9PEZI|nr:hypothetical protein K402DRAFT_451789 [Aulographum hederae CBS 113979]